PGLDAGAALLSGLDDDGCGGVAAHYRVPHGKALLGGRCVGPKLADDQTDFADLVLESSVGGRIVATDAGAYDRHGAPPSLQRRSMGRGVDAFGEPAGDGYALFGQGRRDRAGDP